jgi:hypothetical protein
MNLRRVLLLMTMVLLLTAVVISVAPPRKEEESGGAGAAPAPQPVRSPPPREVDLRFPPPERPPTIRLVQGDHAVVEVATSVAGEATLMGLLDSAEPGTPATFDVLAQEPARHTATFTPQFGKPQRIATFVVGR